MKIGVITDCFKMPLTDSIITAAELGFDGVQIYATGGEFSPEVLTAPKKREIKNLLKSNYLEVSALCGDMGGYGFQIEADNKERIKKTKRIIDLAAEFETNAVTTHIGVIPDSKNHPRYAVLLKALTECGEYAARQGVTLAIETGPEKADTLLSFIKDTNGGVGVNLDPANFVMVTGENPVYAVKTLSDYIVHTHVKDGKMLKKTEPEIIYDCFAKGGIEALNVADYFIETPVGEGDVDFPEYLKALKNIGYDSYLTIERETGNDVRSDIITASNAIRKLLQEK